MKEKLGVDTILILIAIIITALFLILALLNKGEYNGDGTSVGGAISQAIQQANNPAILNFNGKIQGYEGNQNGQTIKGLLNAVENSNKNNERQITVLGGDDIKEDGKYNVSFTKDDDGYINRVNITEQ